MTAVQVGDPCNTGRNMLVVITAQGWFHLFDFDKDLSKPLRKQYEEREIGMAFTIDGIENKEVAKSPDAVSKNSSKDEGQVAVAEVQRQGKMYRNQLRMPVMTSNTVIVLYPTAKVKKDLPFFRSKIWSPQFAR